MIATDACGSGEMLRPSPTCQFKTTARVIAIELEALSAESARSPVKKNSALTFFDGHKNATRFHGAINEQSAEHALE